MERSLKHVQKKFTAVAVGTAILCAFTATLGSYAVVEYRLNQPVTAEQIVALTAAKPEVQQYLQEQKPNHAHFETIAGAIQNDRESSLVSALPFLLVGVFTISSLLGFLLARAFLKPIEETYNSQKRFTQDAAHELRTPLAAMKALVQQSGSKPLNRQQQRQLVTALDAQTDKLRVITDELLLLERKETVGANKQPVNISALLEDVLEELHSMSTAKKMRFKTSIPSELLAVIEPQHFVYMSRNIVENAVKYGGKEMPIEIQLLPRRKGWQLVVKDHGIGIPAEEQELVTGRFYRASNASDIDGTGLGMSLVQKFVELYKGSLRIDSELGKGTTVSITL